MNVRLNLPSRKLFDKKRPYLHFKQGIGVTEEFKISGEETASYNALTLATVDHKDEVSM